MNKKLVRDLELVLEVQELREMGLNEEEIEGFFSLYYENWELNDEMPFDN